jgi:hypothetical protein
MARSQILADEGDEGLNMICRAASALLEKRINGGFR